jgi:hypothetical protein
MFQIDLAADGKLLLYLPDARSVEVSATPGGLNYIKTVIADHQRGLRNQRGYIGTLPTQHSVDKAMADQFLKDKAKRLNGEAIADNKAKASKLDIDWDRLEINL